MAVQHYFGGSSPFGHAVKLLLAFVAILLTLLYSALVIRAVRRERVGKKFYAFMLNRCVGDLFFLIFYIAILYMKEDL